MSASMAGLPTAATKPPRATESDFSSKKRAGTGVKYRPSSGDSGATKRRRAPGRCLNCPTRRSAAGRPPAQVTQTGLPRPAEGAASKTPRSGARPWSRPQTWHKATLKPSGAAQQFHPSWVTGTGIWTLFVLPRMARWDKQRALETAPDRLDVTTQRGEHSSHLQEPGRRGRERPQGRGLLSHWFARAVEQRARLIRLGRAAPTASGPGRAGS